MAKVQMIKRVLTLVNTSSYRVVGSGLSSVLPSWLAMLVGLALACCLPAVAPVRSLPSPVTPVQTAVSTSDRLADAIAMLAEELAARGADPDTIRIQIEGQPRSVSIRFASLYDCASHVYRAQWVLAVLASCRIMLHVEPPVEGAFKWPSHPRETVRWGCTSPPSPGPALTRGPTESCLTKTIGHKLGT